MLLLPLSVLSDRKTQFFLYYTRKIVSLIRNIINMTMMHKKYTLSNKKSHCYTKNVHWRWLYIDIVHKKTCITKVHMRMVSYRESSCEGWGSGSCFLARGKDDIRENSTTVSVGPIEKLLVFYLIVTLTFGEGKWRGVKNIWYSGSNNLSGMKGSHSTKSNKEIWLECQKNNLSPRTHFFIDKKVV